MTGETTGNGQETDSELAVLSLSLEGVKKVVNLALAKRKRASDMGPRSSIYRMSDEYRGYRDQLNSEAELIADVLNRVAPINGKNWLLKFFELEQQALEARVLASTGAADSSET